jgi:hypothetical protein
MTANPNQPTGRVGWIRARVVLTVAAVTLMVPAGLVLTAATARADDAGASHVTFGPDEGSVFVNHGDGYVSIGSGDDSIQSEGTAPTGLGDVANFVFHELTGLDLPVAPQSWIADKVMQALDAIVTTGAPDEPLPAEPVDGGVSGGVSANSPAADDDTAVAQNLASNDGTDPGEQDEGDSQSAGDADSAHESDQGDCPDCPAADAMPQPDGDGGPTGPAAVDPVATAAIPTEDGGPANPLTLLALVVGDGTGPIGPASLLGAAIGTLGFVDVGGAGVGGTGAGS